MEGVLAEGVIASVAREGTSAERVEKVHEAVQSTTSLLSVHGGGESGEGVVRCRGIVATLLLVVVLALVSSLGEWVVVAVVGRMRLRWCESARQEVAVM